MTITSVQAIPIAYPEPNDSDRIRHLLLVKLTASNGQVGWGEAVTMWPEASLATKAIVDGLTPLLLGRDPRDHDSIYRDLQAHTWWYGVGGITSFAISTLDIALWDLAGHLENASLLELIGEAAHSSLPVLVSCHAMRHDLDSMAVEMAGWVRDFDAIGIKVGMGKAGAAGLGHDAERDAEFVRALRRELGPDKSIMMDVGAGIRWDVETAIARAQLFEQDGVDWLEEPLGSDDPEGYKALKASTRVRIAYGEREWTPRGVQRILQTGTVDVVGVDPGRCEGITGWLAARAETHEFGAEINAHAWSSGIVTAASLALSLASTNCHQVEIKPLPSPVQQEMLDDPVTVHEGHLRARTGPGLGIHVDEQVVARLAI